MNIILKFKLIVLKTIICILQVLLKFLDKFENFFGVENQNIDYMNRFDSYNNKIYKYY